MVFKMDWSHFKKDFVKSLFLVLILRQFSPSFIHHENEEENGLAPKSKTA